MTAAASVQHASIRVSDSLSWPPFGAVTNGLSATSWVPIVEIRPEEADTLLRALAVRGIAACTRLRRPRNRSSALVWVDVTGFALAEDLVRSLIHGDAARDGT